MTYRIKDWNIHFETSKTVEYNHCQRITFPNDLNKPQRNRLIKGKDGPGCLAVWFSLCQWMSGQSKPREGYLTDNTRSDGNDLDIEEIAELIKMPERLIEVAFKRLCDPKIGWLEQITVEVGLNNDHTKTIVDNGLPLTPLHSTPLHSTPLNTTIYSDTFLKFWKCYPNKTGKGAAFKSWQKEKPPLDKCITQIKLMKKTDQWAESNGKYIPHPATWLNQRRWDDEVSKSEMGNVKTNTYIPPKQLTEKEQKESDVARQEAMRNVKDWANKHKVDFKDD